jgi:hypothetical protein
VVPVPVPSWDRVVAVPVTSWDRARRNGLRSDERGLGYRALEHQSSCISTEEFFLINTNNCKL